jgi:methyl-accepting chemotaxis protein
MKIGTRLILGFAVNLAFLLMLGGLGIYETKHIAAQSKEAIENDAASVENAQRMRAIMNMMRRYEKDAFINISDPATVDGYVKQWSESREQAKKHMDLLLKIKKEAKDREALLAINKELDGYDTGFNKVMAQIRSGAIVTTQDANKAIGKYKEDIHQAEKNISDYADINDESLTRAKKALDGSAQHAVTQATTIIVISFIVVLTLVTYLIRSIKRPINQIEFLVNDIAQGEGDLTKRLSYNGRDELGAICGSFNIFIEKLRQLIGMVSEETEKVHGNANVIASSVDKQTEFVTQLSSSVVEISSTMEEFSSTASQIAKHSQGVVERADKALEDTKHGAEEVENLTFKMNDISENIQANLAEIVELGRKSKEINKVMEIINNIANQTKLIAFNAALEAASAGEAGKRFGVVAVEIRRLADSVVESTAEIEGKITEILDAVNRLVMSSEKSSQMTMDGQEYASHTVMMLIDMVDGVQETTDAARQISLSTQQQQIASSQVVLALKDIEQGLRYSTDSIRDSSVVTTELAELSGKLRSLVRTFKLVASNTAHNETRSLKTGNL